MTTTTIRSVHLPTPLPRGRDAGAPGVSGAFCNEEKNSRWGREAPRDPLRITAKGALDGEIRRGFVAGLKDRLVVAGESRAALFDAALTRVASVGLPYGPAAVDAAAGVWLAADPFGAIAIRRGSDAGREYLVKAAYDRSFAHEVLGRLGSGWCVLSTELREPGDPSRPPKYAAVTRIESGDSDRVDDDGFRLSAHQARVFRLERPDLLGAFHEGKTYLAYPDHILILDADLVPVADLTGTFVPLGMSLDEAGRIYLLARAEGNLRLWVVTREGDRILDFALPPDFAPESVPPVVGYDHRIFLVGGRNVLAVAPEGKIEWKATFRGEAARAVATPEGDILVAAGSELVVVDRRGGKRTLADLDGDILATAPEPVGATDLAIATRTSLFRLAPKPREAR